MQPIISIQGLSKTYAGGFQALKGVDLEIRKGEIFALLGPNGAGKTTLIGIVCGLVRMTGGTVVADGHDIQKDFRAARTLISCLRHESRSRRCDSRNMRIRSGRSTCRPPGWSG